MLQVKVIIGTIAFMFTMIFLGFAALREPARMQTYTNAALGRSIEAGAHLFDSNCASCHGVDGKAEVCYDAATGEQIGCQGRPLNNRNLVCGDPSKRMSDLQWQGSKTAFIQGTIAAGRPWAGMPTWSQEYGGPLQPNEVANVSNFVMNWESEELCSVPPFIFPWPEIWDDLLALAELPADLETPLPEDLAITLPLAYPGDAARGQELYEITYGCSACHGQMGTPGSNSVGPHLGNIGNDAGTRQPDTTAEQYLYESILNPGGFIASGCPAGDCANAMPNNFADRMSEVPQDMADIMTSLMSQTGN